MAVTVSGRHAHNGPVVHHARGLNFVVAQPGHHVAIGHHAAGECLVEVVQQSEFRIDSVVVVLAVWVMSCLSCA